jgi:hypothetical protein
MLNRKHPLAKNRTGVEESGSVENGGTPPPFFWKCVKRKGFKSFVLKVCETKGVADAFLGNCVKLKSLGSICSLSTPWKKPSGKSWRHSLAGPTAAPGDYDRSTYSTND